LAWHKRHIGREVTVRRVEYSLDRAFWVAAGWWYRGGKRDVFCRFRELLLCSAQSHGLFLAVLPVRRRRTADAKDSRRGGRRAGGRGSANGGQRTTGRGKAGHRTADRSKNDNTTQPSRSRCLRSRSWSHFARGATIRIKTAVLFRPSYPVRRRAAAVAAHQPHIEYDQAVAILSNTSRPPQLPTALAAVRGGTSYTTSDSCLVAFRRKDGALHILSRGDRNPVRVA
jgi:hypothetical protein